MATITNLGIVKPFGLSYLNNEQEDNKGYTTNGGGYQYYYFQNPLASCFNENLTLSDGSNEHDQEDSDELILINNSFLEEHQLFWYNNTVVWSSSLSIKKKFTLPLLLSSMNYPKISNAIWSHFPLLKEQQQQHQQTSSSSSINNDLDDYYKYLCILHNQGLNIYNPIGNCYQIVLPCNILNIWSSKFGLLLERDSSQDSILLHGRDKSEIPSIFSILNPLEELKPILISIPPSKTNDTTINMGDQQEFFSDTNQTILFSSTDYPILITYSNVKNVHIIYQISHVKSDNTTATNNTNSTSINNQQSSVLQQTINNNTIIGSSVKPIFNFNNSSVNDQSFDYGNINTSTVSPFSSKLNKSNLNSTMQSMQSQQTAVTASVQQQQQLSQDTSFKFMDDKSYYFGDDSEFIIKSEIILTQVLLDETRLKSNTKSNSIFITLDNNQKPLLCIQIDTILYCYNIILKQEQQQVSTNEKKDQQSTTTIEKLELEYSFSISSVQSSSSIFLESFYNNNEYTIPKGINQPFKSPSTHILILNENQSTLSVYWGPCKILNLPIIDKSTTSTSTSTSKPLYIKDSTFNRVTIVFSDKQEIRIKISWSESYLVSSCLRSLSLFIPMELLSNLYLHFNNFHKKLTSTSNGSNSNNSEESDKEWISFQILLITLLDKSTNNSKKQDKAIQKEEEEEDSWEFLLNSNYHKNYEKGLSFLSNLKIHDSTTSAATSNLFIKISSDYDCNGIDLKSFKQSIGSIFKALHYQYEEFKVLSFNIDYLYKLSKFLIQLALSLSLYQFVDSYYRDFGDLINYVNQFKPTTTKEGKEATKEEKEEEEPFSIYKFVNDSFKDTTGHHVGSSQLVELFSNNQLIKYHFKWIYKIKSLYSVHGSNGGIKEISEKLVLTMVKMDLKLEDLNSITFGLSLPLREAICNCRSNPPSNWPLKAYTLIEREELIYKLNLNDINNIKDNQKINLLLINGGSGNTSIVSSTSTISNTHSTLSSGITNINNQINNGSNTNINNTNSNGGNINSQGAGNNVNGTGQIVDKNIDEFFDISKFYNGQDEFYKQITQLRFDTDSRIFEVYRLLSFSNKIQIQHQQENGVSDHDYLAQLQSKLLLSVQRTISLPIGYGMFTIRSIKPLPTETITIPPIILNGMVQGTKQNVSLEQINIPDGMMNWPEFHNGVAAGLRVSADQTEITNTWIIYNRPKQFTPSYSGLLMALGLQKRLSSLAFTKLFEYLASGHQLTSVGLLLGISCTKMGTMDMSIAKVLSVHIQSLHPPLSIDLDVPCTVQIAALMGIGLLYMGTSNRRMTEVLLMEIGRKPLNDKQLDRDSYSLTAGMALGFVNLGKGANEGSLTDLQIEDRLRSFIGISQEDSFDHMSTFFNQSYSTPSISSNSKNNNELFNNSTNNSGSTNSGSNKNKSNTILESSKPNIDITAPGAIIALSFIYLKTNNLKISNYLSIPDTSFGLNYIRPDLVLLRILGKNLIMWDSIKPDFNWITSSIPLVVNKSVTIDQTNEKVFLSKKSTGGSGGNSGDFESFILIVCNVIAGSALSIGLKYAGSQNEIAFSLLVQLIKMFRKRQVYLNKLLSKKKNIGNVDGNMDGGGLDKVMRVTTETCLNIIALSLSLVMAGSGNLETLKILSMLRSRVGTEITYGNHMAINMSIGFLFLGGGQYTLSTSNLAIASLVCSLYPRFPISSTDNDLHCQSFRHLYFLAIDPRCLITRDVDNLSPIHVPIDIQVLNNDTGKLETKSLVTPCLIPDISLISSISIKSPRYWNIFINKSGSTSGISNNLKNHPTIFLKRKIGHLPYTEDPDGFKTLSKSFPKSESISLYSSSKGFQKSKEEFLKSFISDPNLLAFAKHFCGTNQLNEFEHFNTTILYECLTQDTPEVIPLLQLLNDIGLNFEKYSNSNSTFVLENLRILFKFYSKWDNGSGTGNGSVNNWLINSSFLGTISTKIDSFYDNQFLNDQTNRKLLSNYLLNGQLPNGSDCSSLTLRKFSSFVSYYNLPTHKQFKLFKPFLNDTGSNSNITFYQLWSVLGNQIDVNSINKIIDLTTTTTNK